MDAVYENTVRFEETDAQGIVFYGNYATYQDETFTEYLAAVGHPYDEIRDRGWDLHVVNMELNYRKPARFRDRLSNSMRVHRIEQSSIGFEYECHNADGELLVDGTVTHVVVDDSGSPTDVPTELREAVLDYQDDPPEGV
ncbi:acyl-CoA thioesterase [Natronomonas sp. F2-12]|jgi:acyl-CoA thioester hydrolase|uniref:Acyl-CoA thioesterase n=1 Tax=Natronomonas aquatica TaxID=2841590 RepID=A0A9R1CQU0_9EURY|nr:acyl-CoA thioesterase [Natronomonas aquatica]MCQ4332172.1 acyl-CoA thioesterase [Natronomonas aquatica]